MFGSKKQKPEEEKKKPSKQKQQLNVKNKMVSLLALDYNDLQNYGRNKPKVKQSAAEASSTAKSSMSVNKSNQTQTPLDTQPVNVDDSLDLHGVNQFIKMERQEVDSDEEQINSLTFVEGNTKSQEVSPEMKFNEIPEIQERASLYQKVEIVDQYLKKKPLKEVPNYPIYTKSELIDIVEKYEKVIAKIDALKHDLIKVEITKNQTDKKKTAKVLKKSLSSEYEARDKIYDSNKLRRTILAGIPCTYLDYEEYFLPKMNEDDTETKAFRYFGPLASDKNAFNLRGRLWKVYCKSDEIKWGLVESYHQKRKADKKQKLEMPNLETPEEVFNFYKNMPNEEAMYDITKDLHRTDPGNDDWKTDFKSGTNSLYNVLMAYANYDPEIRYAQSMNVVVSWILKFTRESSDSFFGERVALKYNECEAFYILLRIMDVLQQRNMYDKEITKLVEHLELIEELIVHSLPEVHEHLKVEMPVNLVPIFTSQVLTFFVADLQQVYPDTAMRIFDVFLSEGEAAIFTLLIRFIRDQQKEILNLYDDDLLNYMKQTLPYESLKKHSMWDLFDYNSTLNQ